MGLTNNNGLVWDNTDHVRNRPHDSFAGIALDGHLGPFVDAFTIADFLSDEPYALENCKKLFGEGDAEFGVDSHMFPTAVDYGRYCLIEVEDQERFITVAIDTKPHD